MLASWQRHGRPIRQIGTATATVKIANFSRALILLWNSGYIIDFFSLNYYACVKMICYILSIQEWKLIWFDMLLTVDSNPFLQLMWLSMKEHRDANTWSIIKPIRRYLFIWVNGWFISKGCPLLNKVLLCDPQEYWSQYMEQDYQTSSFFNQETQ